MRHGPLRRVPAQPRRRHPAAALLCCSLSIAAGVIGGFTPLICNGIHVSARPAARPAPALRTWGPGGGRHRPACACALNAPASAHFRWLQASLPASLADYAAAFWMLAVAGLSLSGGLLFRIYAPSLDTPFAGHLE